MGFFDFFDSRKSIARWAAKNFQDMRKACPNLTDQQIAQFIFASRLKVSKLKPGQDVFIENVLDTVTDVFSLCHLIAEIELLWHLPPDRRANLTIKGENIVEHTQNVIDAELEKLGFEQ